MAPKGRLKKRGNTRKDAAIDAMKPYGFPVKVVKETIKELLNVYGEDGWPFIEDSSYKVLLEAILEKSDSKKPAAAEISSTGTALEPASSDVNTDGTESHTGHGLDCASNANEAMCTLKPRDKSEGKHLSPVEAECSTKSDVQYPSSSGHFTPPPPLQIGNLTVKRRPYHGWICSDDEEDLVELRPGPIAEEMESFLRSFTKNKKRWDMKPDDM
ncbi:hypothetical protein F3Y22_tig00013565pilonHSYRG00019 [Hibiscus syriacus]|uniref:WIYLD domain-containing protein n=1 Tax=Hibiscus syriacus TaxID=106335 RepID=A0A6A3C5F5_HIBSY|nr:uncharacterized protein LOC120206241 [Hibiscus syriacus]KAE8722808.1 hypothetical protein F3Y22_tig00013565pilonHSYRG00019 [Hibiscus syriacus]